MKESSFRPLFNLIRLSAIGVFLGRAWQHIFWEAPYRAMLWDEQWMSWLVEGVFHFSWHDWVTSPAVDSTFQKLIVGIGLFYLLCALAAVFLERYPRICRPVLLLGGVSLVFLALLYTKENFFVPAQFFEYSLQFGSPFFLVILHRDQDVRRNFLLLLKVATALTFTCHGLFALGFYPTPAGFVEMVMNVLGFHQAGAILFLRLAGVLDILISLLLFFPARWAIPALGYAVFWGGITSLARIWAYVDTGHFWPTLAQWTHESVLRAPHFLVPLFLLMYIWEISHQSAAAQQGPDMRVEG